MAILNFKEIPAPTVGKNRNSNDLDAFEKFAEEFFVKVKGAELLERCSRGADGGIDLKIKYDGEACLVSCKHKAHSGTSVTERDEQARGLIDLLNQHKCKKFIAFYSTIASSGLRNRIVSVFENSETAKKEKLSYEFFYSSDIESAILDMNNPRGWLLAMRYFPESYMNLFQRFFIPIEYYNEKSENVEVRGNGYTIKGPFGRSGLISHLQEGIKESNDSLTSAMYENFFYLAIQDAINLFPNYFVYREDANLDKLSINDISPAWDNPLDQEYCKKTVKCNLPIIICGLWSMWDAKKAAKKMIEYRVIRYPSRILIQYNQRYISEEELCYSYLNFGHISKYLNSELRNLFARLVAFCPAGGAKTTLNPEKDGVINFDPHKTGKSAITWQLDLKNLEDYKWLQDRLD